MTEHPDTNTIVSIIDSQLRDGGIGWIKKYHPALRNKHIAELGMIKKLHPGGEMLDVGSSPGIFLYILKESGYNAQGVDIAPDRVRDFLKSNGLTIHKCDIENEKLPFESARFGSVVFSSVIEHLGVNPLNAVNEIYRVLKPGGVLMLGTPNIHSADCLFNIIKGHSFNDAHAEFSKLSLGHMGHIRLYAEKELIRWFEKLGFAHVKSRFTGEYKPTALKRICWAVPKFRPYMHIIFQKEGSFE